MHFKSSPKITKVPALPVLFVNLDLNLNDSESVIPSFGSFLQYCHKLPDVLHNYHNIILNYTFTSQYQLLLHYLLVY